MTVTVTMSGDVGDPHGGGGTCVLTGMSTGEGLKLGPDHCLQDLKACGNGSVLKRKEQGPRP